MNMPNNEVIVCSGSFGISAPQVKAQKIATNFLEEDEVVLTEDQRAEVIGEVANMTCGVLLARIGSRHAFALTSPRTPRERSTGYTEGTAGVNQTLHTFALDEGILHVWSGIGMSL